MTLGRFLLIAAHFGFLGFAGCGYRLKVPVNEVFINPKGISVVTFDNRSEEVGAERVFTNALIREIQNRRDIVLVSPEEAGANIRGTITSIAIGPTASSGLGFKGLQGYKRIPTELGVRVTLDLVLEEAATKRALWSKSFTGFRRVNAPINRTSDYQSPSSLGLTTQSLWESLYPDVAQVIMQDVYDEMMENF